MRSAGILGACANTIAVVRMTLVSAPADRMGELD